MSEEGTYPSESDTRIVDPAKAEEMAYAGKELRELGAYNRIAYGIKEKYAPASSSLQWELHTGDKTRHSEIAGYLQTVHQIVAGELATLAYLYPDKVRNLHIEEQGQTVDISTSDARWFLHATDDSSPFGRPRKQWPVDWDPDLNADKLEGWASRLYRNSAVEMTPQDCVEEENKIANAKHKIAAREQELAELKEQSDSGELSVVDATTAYNKYYGNPAIKKTLTERDERWLGGITKNETTLAELKKFLFDEIEVSLRGFQERTAARQATLDSI